MNVMHYFYCGFNRTLSQSMEVEKMTAKEYKVVIFLEKKVKNSIESKLDNYFKVDQSIRRLFLYVIIIHNKNI